MISKELLENLYNKKGLKQHEIAKELNSSQSTISYLLRKHGIKKSKPKRHFCKWTSKEIDTLTTLYGVDSIQSISNSLGRSIDATIQKIRVLELGEAKNATEYITAAELGKALGRSASTVVRWINSRKLPAIYKTVTQKKKIYRIDVKKFWNWCKTNLHHMKWELYERNSLGKEPIWLDEVIKKYYKNIVKKSCERWGIEDLCYLKHYYDLGLTKEQIAKNLGRSTRSIDAQITKSRISKRKVNIRWKPVETKTLIQMKNDNFTFECIADELGRSIESVEVKYCRILKEQLKANV